MPSYHCRQWRGFASRMRSRSDRVLRVAVGQRDVAPVDATHLGLRRVPRMVGVGEAHPAEPVVVRREPVEPRDRAVGDPVGVVPVAWIGLTFTCGASVSPPPVALTLKSPSIAEIEHPGRLGMVEADPLRVVEHPRRAVSGELEVVEAAVRTDGAVRPPARQRLLARARDRVLDEAAERVHERLEVRLAHERGAVAVPVQLGRHRGRVDGQRHAVHPHTVRARVLPGEHRRARRHAHHRLRDRALVADALRRERVDHRRARDLAAVAPERVVALLVGRDEQDLAAHQDASNCRLSSRSALPVAPPITKATGSGSASVE